jgi:hypothetical protein
MRARVLQHGVTRPLELALAALGAAAVAGLLLGVLPSHLDVLGLELRRFTLFPLLLSLALWLPLAAQRRRSGTGELSLEGRELVLQTRWGRPRLGRVEGVHVAVGARGASLLFSVRGGGLVAAAVDEPAQARWFADRVHSAGIPETVAVPRSWGTFGWVARVVGTLSALAYWLHVVHQAIPGQKALYGLGALFSAVALLVFHFVRRRGAWVLDRDEVRASPDAPAEVPQGARTTLGGVAVRVRGGEITVPLGELGPAVREQLAAHVRAMGKEAPPPAPPPEEPVHAALARLRVAVGAGADAYRGASEALRARLEQTARSPEAPLRERALALRVVAGGDAGEVRRRIAESGDVAPEDAHFLESVALAETDDAAASAVEKKAPRFVG